MKKQKTLAHQQNKEIKSVIKNLLTKKNPGLKGFMVNSIKYLYKN